MDEPIKWHEIAACVGGRSNKDCRKRWVYSLSQPRRKGAWEKKEDSRLLEGVQVSGTRWAQVSRIVGSRNADRMSCPFPDFSHHRQTDTAGPECSRRWHEVLKPSINRGRWSLFEVGWTLPKRYLAKDNQLSIAFHQDEMLKRAVLAHGRRWIEIVERYFPDRTPIGTKNR